MMYASRKYRYCLNAVKQLLRTFIPHKVLTSMNCSAGEVKAFTSFRATCNDLATNITGISTDMYLQKSPNYITMKVTEWTITEETGSLVFFRGKSYNVDLHNM